MRGPASRDKTFFLVPRGPVTTDVLSRGHHSAPYDLAVGSGAWIRTDDGIRLWSASGGRGPDLALAHGGPGLWDYLQPVAELLHRRFQVHRWDQRVGGRSDPNGPFTVDRPQAGSRRGPGRSHLAALPSPLHAQRPSHRPQAGPADGGRHPPDRLRPGLGLSRSNLRRRLFRRLAPDRARPTNTLSQDRCEASARYRRVQPDIDLEGIVGPCSLNYRANY